MGLEAPVVSAVMARLADPEIHLAAYGGVVLPLALTIEAPVIMLLAASVALAKDAHASRLIYRFMMIIGAALTLLHLLVAFTPLFDKVVLPLLGAPAGIGEPARLGFQIMLPWTWAIGYRRFHQGLLIRYGRSFHVTVGTVLRLIAVSATAAVAGFALGASGIVAATAAISVGVVTEAVYSAWAALPVTRRVLPGMRPEPDPLRLGRFLTFYLPLVLTSLLSLLVQPIGSAAIARMPGALASLAVWPVVNGLLFMLRAVSFALNEVVVALLDRPGAYAALRTFTIQLALGLLAITSLVAFTPLAHAWFGVISGLDPTLTALAVVGFAWALVWPSLDAFRNLVQGIAVYAQRTRAISTSMVLFLLISAALLTVGVVTQRFTALPAAMVAFVGATICQVAWLAWRVRPEVKALVSGPSPATASHAMGPDRVELARVEGE